MRLAPIGRSNKKNFYLNGGPWSGDFAKLPPETMIFSAKGMTGRYVMGGWEDV